MMTLDAHSIAVGRSMLTPEARAAAEGYNQGVTLTQGRDALDHAQTQADQRALKSWLVGYESHVRAQIDRLADESISREAEQAERLCAQQGHDRLSGWAKAIAAAESGQLTAADVRQMAAEAERFAAEYDARAEDATLNFQNSERLRAMDPADFQQEQLRRLPAMRDRLPALLGEMRGPAAPHHHHYHPKKGVDCGPSYSAKADSARKLLAAALDILEQLERRERLMSGPHANALSDRLPAMRSRIQ
jgi:hypothetical protein